MASYNHVVLLGVHTYTLIVSESELDEGGRKLFETDDPNQGGNVEISVWPTLQDDGHVMWVDRHA